jgi:TIR domain
MGIKRAFISHASGESELAKLLKERIESDFLGVIDVFVSSDGTSLVAGTQWLEEVKARLRDADFYIVLCSQHSVDRPWINIELGAALTRDKPVIPLCHTDLLASQLVRRPLSDYESFDAANPDGLRNLYEALRQALASRMPNVDFAGLARQVHEFEITYKAQKKLIEAAVKPPPREATARTLQHPSALCVSSEQFRETVREDLALILAAFPDQVHHEAITTSADVRTILVRQHFDIVHVAAYVCPVSGDLVFSPVDPVTKRDLAGPRDGLPAEAFAHLIKEADVSLVVLAHNETLALVTMLLPVTSVVFALEPVDSSSLIEWIKGFYGFLAEGLTIAESCRKAFALHQIPMMLYPRLEETADAWRAVAAAGR